MTGLRLCRDCRWKRYQWFGSTRHCLNHSVAPVTLDIVTGATKQKEVFCAVARMSGEPCAPEGKFWEPSK